MRRSTLTLLMAAAIASVAIALTAWAGPVTALLALIALLVPVAALALRPHRHRHTGDGVATGEGSEGSHEAMDTDQDVRMRMAPTEPMEPMEPETLTEASEAPAASFVSTAPDGETTDIPAAASIPEGLDDESRPPASNVTPEPSARVEKTVSKTEPEDESTPEEDEGDVAKHVAQPDGTEDDGPHDLPHDGVRESEAPAKEAPEVDDPDTLDEIYEGLAIRERNYPSEDEPLFGPTRKETPVSPTSANPKEKVGSLDGRGDGDQGSDIDGLAEPSQSFSWADVEFRLLSSPHPLQVLGREVKRIRRNEDTVTAAERFLARRIEDTGVLDKDVAKKAKHVSITSLTRSDLLYIRGLNGRIEYGLWLSLISLEETLNLMRRANEHYGDLSLVSEAELSSYERRLMSRVLFEAPLVDTANWTYLAMPWQFPAGPAEHGEWSCRHQLAETIESLRLPWRLRTRFHANVAEGILAIEFDVTPADALPKHSHVAGLGLQQTTPAWRSREASAYAARVGLLLAALGFASSRRIRSVFVKAIHNTPDRHLCLFTAEFDRRTFSHLRLQSITDPVATLVALGASIDATDGELSPVPERFHLGDAAFCPARRHDIMTLEDHVLPASAARALGAKRLLDLSIHEELGRILAADDILRHQSPLSGITSAEESVRTIMDVAASTSDISVWDAATRVVRQIVDGSLSCDDAWALRDEFVEGDDLSRALSRSRDLFMDGDIGTAARLIENALTPLDKQGLYRDSESVAYRSFDNFTERVLYNRMNADDARVVSLVPDSYLIAHIALASIFLADGTGNKAQLARSLAHVRRALDIAPMNTPATMLLSTILEATGNTDGSQEVLSSYLAHAFNPQGIGYAYLKLAEAAAEEGDERRAFSCYQMCMHTMPALTPVVFMQSQIFGERGLVFPDDMGMREVQECLEAAGIPLAPTQHTFFDLFDGAIAATDAEIFPVARDIMSFIEALTGDDVMHAVRESLEREPDA